MRRFAVVVVLAICLCVQWVGLSASLAQVLTRDETSKLEKARALVRAVDDEQDKKANDFNGLLELRDKLEPAVDDIGAIVSALQQRVASATAQLAEFGTVPAAGSPAESPQIAADRAARQKLADELSAQLRGARALQVQADQLWDELTDARRALFNSRILDHQESLLYPGFWTNFARIGWPDLTERIADELREIKQSIDEKQGWSALLGTAVLILAVIFGLMLLERWLQRRRRAIKIFAADPLARSVIIRRALLTFVMLSMPFIAAALVIWFTGSRFDIVPDEVNTFMLGVAGASAVYGVANGAARAVFAPISQRFRIIRADDATARRAVVTLDLMLIVYILGMIILGLIQAVSAPVVLTIATTGVTSIIVVAIAAVMLTRRPKVDESARHGLIAVPLHLLRPVLWVAGVLVIGAVAFGYTALAGFVIGRTLATAVIICLSVMIYVAIDVIFHDAIAPGQPANVALAGSFGVRPSTVDLIGTIVAGSLRVAVVASTVLVLLSPWGVEFGNVNPFVDVFFGLRFGDLRGWIGSAGIALMLFTVGLLGTRLFVTWLDQQLLPRTALNDGVRHSISTIAGYLGFILALSIALAQAGVQLQNVALVASALSVGIGFGLQQMVSNFVAGLIVLAERPIRVGDVINVKGEEGKVAKISVRSTEILLGENSTLIVPNSDIISSVVKNRSFNDNTHRTTLKFIFTFQTDIDAAFAILQGIAKQHRDVLASVEPKLVVARITESGIETEMHVMCDRIAAMEGLRSDIYRAALKAFRANGIELASTPPPPAAPSVSPQTPAQ